MRLAIISDIHGNLMALESVLEDIDTRDVDEVICLGDLMGYLPYPNEVVDLLSMEDMMFVLGNHDQKVIKGPKISEIEFRRLSSEEQLAGASLAYMQYILKDVNRQFLEWCPEQMTMKIEGKSILCVHGSPDSISEYLYDDKEKLKQVADTLKEDILLCGHTHLPYHVELKGKHFINPGSVGKPKDGDPRACYTLLDVEAGKVTTEVIRVTYDIESMVDGIKENKFIDDALIENLRSGK